VLAYQGSETAVRQKFERDKKAIREYGFDIETVVLPDDSSGYQIDPASGYAPVIYFTEEEQRVVRLALRFCGFGNSGAFSVFNDVPAGDGGLEYSAYIGPIIRALRLRRVVSFEYQSSTKKVRTVEPLRTYSVDGSYYLVARVVGSGELKGYRFSRMTSMPIVHAEGFDADDVGALTHSLSHKRARVAATAWPRLADCLGVRFEPMFQEHVAPTPQRASHAALLDGFTLAGWAEAQGVLDVAAVEELAAARLHWVVTEAGLAPRSRLLAWARARGPTSTTRTVRVLGRVWRHRQAHP
jgi:hypothetical protein